jgi:phosphatidylserine decarboxylase
MGWFSHLRLPWLAKASIAVWRVFTDLDLSDARSQRFASLHDCFTRELVPGARPIEPDPTLLASPCDAIVGACGRVADGQLFQAKGSPYRLEDLFGPTQDTAAFRDGTFITLRLTSSMYHRFHAPHDGAVEHVTYLSGDTWNVNPIALARIERLFCRNERAVLRMRLARGGQPIALVPVAAILVASIRLHFLVLLHLRYRGPNEIPVQASFTKGQEMGWFEHGSTIIIFTPPGFRLCDGIETGARIRMGQALLAIHAVVTHRVDHPAPT